MKFLSIASPSQPKEYSIALKVSEKVEDTTLISLPIAFESLKAQGRVPTQVNLNSLTDMISFIKHSDQTLPLAQAILTNFKEGKLPPQAILSESSVKVVSPIPHPISCRDGYAFRQHVESARKGRGLPMIPEFDLFPIFYFTNHLAITGPGKVKVMERHLDRLDFELEVAIVIGKEGRNIPAEKADQHIFGYLIMNDWSARGLQTEEMKMNLGPAKGKDFATSLGPYLVTPDELEKFKITHPNKRGDRYDLSMKAFVNGKQVSDGNMKDMTWTFAEIVERASYGVTLYPGEVIGSGTVGTGCFMELNATGVTQNWWLKPGDEITLEVQGLGKLTNTLELERA